MPQHGAECADCANTIDWQDAEYKVMIAWNKAQRGI
jgi:hypothetical protein